MRSTAIKAYDLPARVASYDADMDIMHPNRHKMAEVMLGFLPFASTAALHALDLGIGTGFLAQRFLQKFPAAGVVGIDGAAAMLDLAATRLGPAAQRVVFRTGDFRELQPLVATDDVFDVVISAYALHHLNAVDKLAVLRQIIGVLKPGGWFASADIVVAATAALEQRMQALRLAGIVARASGKDERFRDLAATRRFLDELEANDGDQPLRVRDDLALITRAGLQNVTVVWQEYREVVYVGQKQA